MSNTSQLPPEDDIRFQDLLRYIHLDPRIRNVYVVLITVINKSSGEAEEFDTRQKFLDPQAANICAAKYFCEISRIFGPVVKSRYEAWKYIQHCKMYVTKELEACHEGRLDRFDYTFRAQAPAEGIWFRVWVQVREEARWMKARKEKMRWFKGTPGTEKQEKPKRKRH